VRTARSLALAVAVGALCLPLLLGGRRLALGLIITAAAYGGLLLGRRAGRAKAAETRRALVVETCEALVGELQAGQPFVAALAHCCGLWPALEPVVAAARLDADVPTALRRVAQAPGAEGLTEVAAAWQVSHETGSGLAAALARVAAGARARQRTQALVHGELASAQATARLVAGLPVVSLAMSAGIGGHPWTFLLATVPGLACLALGLGFAFAGLVWIDLIASGVVRSAH
jgi:tight adherence protein B